MNQSIKKCYASIIMLTLAPVTIHANPTPAPAEAQEKKAESNKKNAALLLLSVGAVGIAKGAHTKRKILADEVAPFRGRIDEHNRHEKFLRDNIKELQSGPQNSKDWNSASLIKKNETDLAEHLETASPNIAKGNAILAKKRRWDLLFAGGLLGSVALAGTALLSISRQLVSAHTS